MTSRLVDEAALNYELRIMNYDKLPKTNNELRGLDELSKTNNLLTCSLVNSSTFTNCFRKWLVGMVASLLDENVVNNTILVFVGKQGIYKTTFFNNLLPPELQKYFFTKTNCDRMTKDDKLSLAEFALICLEEIDSMKPAELNQLKALVTSKTIVEYTGAEIAANKKYQKPTENIIF